MKKIALSLLGVALAATAACSTPTDKDALPAGSDKFPTETSVAAGTVEETTTTTARATTTTTTAAASTCDVVREALLTGSPAEIAASMRALVADKTADATAREYADYYLNRDKNEPSLQDMDISLIRMSCS